MNRRIHMRAHIHHAYANAHTYTHARVPKISLLEIHISAFSLLILYSALTFGVCMNIFYLQCDYAQKRTHSCKLCIQHSKDITVTWIAVICFRVLYAFSKICVSEHASSLTKRNEERGIFSNFLKSMMRKLKLFQSPFYYNFILGV